MITHKKPVAILCAATKSVYHSMPDVEVYDIRRDVRTFAGGMPIVAHPPCRSWSAFCSHQAKPVAGEKELGPLCVKWLRECGGVLEHPAHSRLFAACDLPLPGEPARNGLRTIAVQQAWFGYPMKKATWLCLAGVDMAYLPEIPFAWTPANSRRTEQLMSKRRRAETIPRFAEWLVQCAKYATIPTVTTCC